ncbi:hypothetical protein BaRGS_00011638, partial [Batillaria attramentaria]
PTPSVFGWSPLATSTGAAPRKGPAALRPGVEIDQGAVSQASIFYPVTHIVYVCICLARPACCLTIGGVDRGKDRQAAFGVASSCRLGQRTSDPIGRREVIVILGLHKASAVLFYRAGLEWGDPRTQYPLNKRINVSASVGVADKQTRCPTTTPGLPPKLTVGRSVPQGTKAAEIDGQSTGRILFHTGVPPFKPCDGRKGKWNTEQEKPALFNFLQYGGISH